MNTDRHSPMPVRRIKRGPPCSCCGGREEDIGLCCCGEYFCVNCIDAHFDEDDPDFYSAIYLSDPNRPVDLRVEGSIDWGNGNNGARVDAPRLPSGLPRSGTDIESQPLWADSKEGGKKCATRRGPDRMPGVSATRCGIATTVRLTQHTSHKEYAYNS